MAVDFPSNPSNGQQYSAEGKTWEYRDPPGAWFVLGGELIETFTDLTDTPADYSAIQLVRVNAAGDAIEYAKRATANVYDASSDAALVPVNGEMQTATLTGAKEYNISSDVWLDGDQILLKAVNADANALTFTATGLTIRYRAGTAPDIQSDVAMVSIIRSGANVFIASEDY